jgi:hypothetical protein
MHVDCNTLRSAAGIATGDLIVRIFEMDKPNFIKLLEHGEEVGLSGTDFDHVLDCKMG